MDQLTGPLLALALSIIGSILLKAIRDRPRGTGRPSSPPIHEKPATAEPTPARSATASTSAKEAAGRRTPPA